MKHDDEAKAQFALFVKTAPANDAQRDRAMRFIEDPELARAGCAPRLLSPRSMGGKSLSMIYKEKWF